MHCRVLNWISTDVSEVCAAAIISLMMEAARTYETTFDVQLRARQYIPEDSELHTRRRENFKSPKSLINCSTADLMIISIMGMNEGIISVSVHLRLLMKSCLCEEAPSIVFPYNKLTCKAVP
jgi:hypothetical protein